MQTPIKYRKAIDQLRPLRHWAKKVGELWYTSSKDISGKTLIHPSGLRETTFWPSSFYTRYNPVNCLSGRTCGAGRPQIGLCHIFLDLLILCISGIYASLPEGERS